MALGQKKLLKKKQKKADKRKKIVSSKRKQVSLNTSMKHQAATHAHCPIHECLLPDNLFNEMGLGEVVVCRKSQDGYAVGIFLVDVFCLGVKDAYFKLMPEYAYETELKPQITQQGSRGFHAIDPCCARKIVEGAVEYAKNLGFNAHSDYHKAKAIFGDIDVNSCNADHQFGKDGSPCYMQGPYESPQRVRKILSTLKNSCGDNFHYLTVIEGLLEDDGDEVPYILEHEK